MRCLIGYFGLTRSLRHTAGSIAYAIDAPLRRAGIEVRRAGHFNVPETIDNPRSGERAWPTDRLEAALGLDLCVTEPQAAANVVDALAAGRAYPDRFGDEYRSLANLCQQLRSLDAVWTLLGAFGPCADDVVVLLRPDLFYLDPVDPRRDFAPLLDGRADWIVPAWQSWGGLNDRFAFASVRGVATYATRWRAFAQGCGALGGMHAETFLHWVARSHAMTVATTGLRAARVRAHGRVALNDLGLFAQQGPSCTALVGGDGFEPPALSV